MIYAIGDIHGELGLLERLLGEIACDAEAKGLSNAELIFVGDYVDRGPDSKGVIDRLMKPIDGFVTTCLLGNHEQIFLDFTLEEDKDLAAMWMREIAGGKETLRSYGLDVAAIEKAIRRRRSYANFLDDIPSAHMEWISALPLSHETDRYFFVHAGIAPGIALDQQIKYDMIWIRNEFLDDIRDHGKVVVHGHTPARQGEMLFNRINVDTGACFWGTLTAVALSDDAPRYIQVSK